MSGVFSHLALLVADVLPVEPVAEGSSLLFVPGTVPFSIALVVMLGIGVLELISTLLGAGLSGLIDGILPDFDIDADLDLELETDVDADIAPTHGVIMQSLSWLYFGKVPALILFVIFLGAFGMSGLTIQGVVEGVSGHMLPPTLAMLPAFFASLPVMRVGGAVAARLLPKDETDAVSRNTFIGRVATVGQATATGGNPAQAKLRDQHGHTHYVLVEPDEAGVTLAPGSEVLIVRQSGAKFFAIKNTSAALTSD